MALLSERTVKGLDVEVVNMEHYARTEGGGRSHIDLADELEQLSQPHRNFVEQRCVDSERGARVRDGEAG